MITGASLSIDLAALALALLFTFAGGACTARRWTSRAKARDRSMDAFDALVVAILILAAFLLGGLLTYVYIAY